VINQVLYDYINSMSILAFVTWNRNSLECVELNLQPMEIKWTSGNENIELLF